MLWVASLTPALDYDDRRGVIVDGMAWQHIDEDNE